MIHRTKTNRTQIARTTTSVDTAPVGLASRWTAPRGTWMNAPPVQNAPVAAGNLPSPGETRVCQYFSSSSGCVSAASSSDAIHGSDADETARFELSFFFAGYELAQ